MALRKQTPDVRPRQPSVAGAARASPSAASSTRTRSSPQSSGSSSPTASATPLDSGARNAKPRPAVRGPGACGRVSAHDRWPPIGIDLLQADRHAPVDDLHHSPAAQSNTQSGTLPTRSPSAIGCSSSITRQVRPARASRGRSGHRAPRSEWSAGARERSSARARRGQRSRRAAGCDPRLPSDVDTTGR